MAQAQQYAIVDDSDLVSISYETPDLWKFSTIGGDAAYNGTITNGTAGAKATVGFNGTAIGVAGLALTVPGVGPPSVEFSLDGKVKDIATAPMNGTMKDIYPYFSIEDLDGSVEHSLEIRVLNATQQYPFILDAILYVPSNRGALPATQSFLTTALPTKTGASTDSTVTKSSSVPVGPIVGGVIGGLALLLATSIAVCHLCFRRRRSTGQPYFYATSAEAGDLLKHELKAEPYHIPPPQSTVPTSSAHSYVPSQYSAPPSGLGYSAHNPSEAPVSDYGSSAAGSSHASSLGLASGSRPHPTAGPNQPYSKAAEAGLLSLPQSGTYHADSGVRFDANGQPLPSASSSNVLVAPELVDVPPGYSAA